MSLTGKEYWSSYWASKHKTLIKTVTESYLFADILKKYLPVKQGFSFLELGGFPGYFCIFFQKYFGYDTSLLDFHIDCNVVKTLCEANNLQDTIEIIKSDILEYDAREKYDVVLSTGLIEHFQNPEIMIKRHADFTKKDGYAVVCLPNFRGINGFFQKIFDPENYKAHNLRCMDLNYLRRTFAMYHLDVIYSSYYGKFGLWLEEIERRSRSIQYFIRLCNFLGSLLCSKNESRLFSPYIVLIGRNQDNVAV